MGVNLFYPAILTNLITIVLLLISKLHDKKLLIFMIIGEFILINGESNKNLKNIELSHIIFTLSIIIGSFYFSENINLYFIGIFILLRFITKFIYDGCLFNNSNNNYEFEFQKGFNYINWDIIYIILLIIIIYRISKSKIKNIIKI